MIGIKQNKKNDLQFLFSKHYMFKRVTCSQIRKSHVSKMDALAILLGLSLRFFEHTANRPRKRINEFQMIQQ